MKLTALKFDGSENACQSLRMLAELARCGDLSVTGQHLPSGTLQILITEPTRRERRKAAEVSKS